MSAKALKVTALIIASLFLLTLIPGSQVAGKAPLIFTVDSTADIADNAGNSVCSAGEITGGPCTLRAAVFEAAINVPYVDVIINIPAGEYLLTIPPEEANDTLTGDLDIYPAFDGGFAITINGTGAAPTVIDANQLDRVFDIGNAEVTMHNLVIRNGHLEVTEEQIWGGGIRNKGYLTLNHVVVEDNTMDCDPADCPWAYGGGIYNIGGSLTLVASTIQNNTSPDASAIYTSSAEVLIIHSTIRDNYAVRGETIYTIGAQVQIINSTLAGNTSGGTAGIMNYGDLYIASSTFANAGIAASIDHRYGSVTIRDSIFYAAPRLAGISYNCFIVDEELPWTSLGHNIYSDDSCPADGAGDLINTDPLLGELDWWGGPTMTMPLLFASPAIDHRADVCLDITGSPLVDDQRYVPRDDGYCDTGAFEGVIYPVKLFLPLITR